MYVSCILPFFVIRIFGAANEESPSSRTNIRRQQYKLVQYSFERSSGDAAMLVFNGNWREPQGVLPASVVTTY